MVISLLGSLGIAVIGPLGFGLEEDALRLLNNIDFDETLLHGMLTFLLFAGALHIDLDRLARQKWIIGTLATVGTVGSTFMIGIYIFNHTGKGAVTSCLVKYPGLFGDLRLRRDRRLNRRRQYWFIA